jgi:hypothetical protein
VEPILIKKGTKLIATWVFDNSTNNKKLNATNKDSEGSPSPPTTTWSAPASSRTRR